MDNYIDLSVENSDGNSYLSNKWMRTSYLLVQATYGDSLIWLASLVVQIFKERVSREKVFLLFTMHRFIIVE